MTDSVIFKLAIERAISNGYQPFVLKVWIADMCFNLLELTIFKTKVRGIVFSHEFAKAFFGEWLVDKRNGEEAEAYNPKDEENSNAVLAWEYHLQKMVVRKEPLKYLEKFL